MKTTFRRLMHLLPVPYVCSNTPAQHGWQRPTHASSAALLVSLMLMLMFFAASAEAAKTKASDKAFQACLSSLAPKATVAGLSEQRFTSLLSGLSPDQRVLEKLDFQPEFVLTSGEYIQRVVNSRRIEAGRAKIDQHASLLADLEAEFGVPREVLAAVWGVETNYGSTTGSFDLLRSLSTLSCFGRRQEFFRRELMASLQIIDAGHVRRAAFQGSWAGAFGHTQFMPTTFLRMSVDFDRDGRRDLVGSIADALASTATYLVKRGWQTGQPWGIEVRLPKDMVLDAESRQDRRALSDWTGLGVRAATAEGEAELAELPSDTRAALLRPDDAGGPVVLVFQNFNAVFAYNPSIKYALAIHHLADRLAGKPAFIEPWPASARALSMSERRELQRLLTQRGHSIGPIDGIVGRKTRAAIRREQKRLGMTIDGRPNQALIDRLAGRSG